MLKIGWRKSCQLLTTLIPLVHPSDSLKVKHLREEFGVYIELSG